VLICADAKVVDFPEKQIFYLKKKDFFDRITTPAFEMFKTVSKSNFV
jgi:hypothetical protein